MRTVFPIVLALLLFACKDKTPSMAGDYTVTQNGVTTTASLKTDGTALSGLINIGGSAGVISGTITGTTASGTIAATEEKKNYPFTGLLTGDTLKLIIRFAELNNSEITLNLKRLTPGAQPAAKTEAAQKTEPEKGTGTGPADSKTTAEPAPAETEAAKPATAAERDSRLVGTWKNTEVISSGSGDSYGSFSSESFIQFSEDGTVYMWAGRSAGGGGGQSFESDGSTQKQKGKWRTEGKYIVFTDPGTGQEGKTQFMVDAGRMLLSDGGTNKKIYIRID